MQKTNLNKVYFIVAFLVISSFVVYRQATDQQAISLGEQEARHMKMLRGDSEFFNPWQYRIFSTYAVEYTYQILHSISNKISRTHAFLAFRFGQNILVLLMLQLYLVALGIRNPWLIMVGLILTGFCMATSVFKSDLSFNTYFDILFYLIAAWLIIKEKLIWIIPLTAVAALNRETSLFIPFMVLAPFIPNQIRQVPKKNLLVVVGALMVFAIVFILVRVYYGYQPPTGIHGIANFLDYLKFNLTFFRMYFELAGTLTFLPVLVLLFSKHLPELLRKWFWLICPTWFAIHLAYSTAVETRLFLVPQVLIFIPAFLWLVENWYAPKTPAILD